MSGGKVIGRRDRAYFISRLLTDWVAGKLGQRRGVFGLSVIFSGLLFIVGLLILDNYGFSESINI